MDANDLRRMLLKQRRLFGGQNKMARELGIGEIVLSRFMCRNNPAPRADCMVLQVLGVEIDRHLEVRHEFRLKDDIA